MRRTRPIEKRGSVYITPDGFESLKTEYSQLWIHRRDVTKHLAAAAAEGDRSENAEYHYRKKQLREIDRRIRYLQKRLDELVVVVQKPSDSTRIFFGAWVQLEDAQNERRIYRIVGADEFDVKKGYISLDSPVARSLINKKIDDEVTVELPNGVEVLYIVAVSYSPIIVENQ